jgi:hypothetical protein
MRSTKIRPAIDASDGPALAHRLDQMRNLNENNGSAVLQLVLLIRRLNQWRSLIHYLFLFSFPLLSPPFCCIIPVLCYPSSVSAVFALFETFQLWFHRRRCRRCRQIHMRLSARVRLSFQNSAQWLCWCKYNQLPFGSVWYNNSRSAQILEICITWEGSYFNYPFRTEKKFEGESAQ